MNVLRPSIIAVFVAGFVFGSSGAANAATTTAYVGNTPTSIAMPDGLGNIVFPARAIFSDGASSATVTMEAFFGSAPVLPTPPNDNAPLPPAAPSTIIESLAFSFDRDVRFPGFPTIEAAVSPKLPDANAPFLVEIFDAATSERLAILSPMERRTLTFLGQYTAPFNAVRGHRYIAEVVQTPSVARYKITNAQTSVTLPSAGGIQASFELPPGTGDERGPSAVVSAYTNIPVGFPRLAGPYVKSVKYVAKIVMTGTEDYDGVGIARFTLPPGTPLRLDSFGLAVYDSQWFTRGWLLLPAVAVQSSPTGIRFAVPVSKYRAIWRPYGIALYESTKPISQLSGVTPALPHAAESPHPFTLAAIGESPTLLTLLPGSPTPCENGWGPFPECQFTADPNADVPGVVGNALGVHVINLATLGSQLVADTWLGASAMAQQIPQIPADADVVLFEGGINDLAFNGMKPETSSLVDTVTQAIRARAPHAHIVYMGLRCFRGCNPEAVTAWNGAARKDAALYGAFVDTIPFGPSGANASYPDGGHPAIATARAIGEAAANAIRPWMLASAKRSSFSTSQ